MSKPDLGAIEAAVNSIGREVGLMREWAARFPARSHDRKMALAFADVFYESAEEIKAALHLGDRDRMAHALSWARSGAIWLLSTAVSGGVGTIAGAHFVPPPEAVVECAQEVLDATDAALVVVVKLPVELESSSSATATFYAHAEPATVSATAHAATVSTTPFNGPGLFDGLGPFDGRGPAGPVPTGSQPTTVRPGTTTS